ncbi:transcriptional regulator GcvA [Edaphosphingomonas haloaromaticamans]|uniref:Glycine cleavage system transcriptional activator n=1 Tax=Edaphosphingomonas haloaromaticamans TaxID=653954 RepID=A0A1S1HDA1_9SPHN|nr:transcriptional regulator GcvA [Sphingomonas haloaromaticamans]OHT18440.1 Glycine cleavage system transcriptional activator [Sphingomonas haloaromaticamans]
MSRISLPPLAAVRAFEAAARHESFTRAADELGMTQAAVSYQIRLLEERLGARLFLRKARQVVLTDVGRRLSPVVTGAFDQLVAAFANASEDLGGVLRISAVHSFAALWLAPRLGGFQIAQPDIAVALDTDNRIIDFAREEFDCAIRSGDGEWPGLVRHFLFRVHFAPVCSPALLPADGAPLTPADLLRQPRLSPEDVWWIDWFAAKGIDVAEAPHRPSIRLDSQAIEGAAAVAGQGFAILAPALWHADIAAGRLVRPFDDVVFGGGAFWLVYPEYKRNTPKIRAFRDWLLARVAEHAAIDDTGAFRPG